MAGLFCLHKRLATSCPECRPQALPKQTLEGEARFVTEDERDRRREAQERGRATPGDPARGDPEAKPRRPPAATPAAAAALARRQKAARKITAAEAESAKAWWVKK